MNMTLLELTDDTASRILVNDDNNIIRDCYDDDNTLTFSLKYFSIIRNAKIVDSFFLRLIQRYTQRESYTVTNSLHFHIQTLHSNLTLFNDQYIHHKYPNPQKPWKHKDQAHY